MTSTASWSAAHDIFQINIYLAVRRFLSRRRLSLGLMQRSESNAKSRHYQGPCEPNTRVSLNFPIRRIKTRPVIRKLDSCSTPKRPPCRFIDLDHFPICPPGYIVFCRFSIPSSATTGTTADHISVNLRMSTRGLISLCIDLTITLILHVFHRLYPACIQLKHIMSIHKASRPSEEE